MSLDAEILSRALATPSGLRIRAHHSALLPLWRRLSRLRRKEKEAFGALIFRLRSDHLDIQKDNTEAALAPLEEIFQ